MFKARKLNKEMVRRGGLFARGRPACHTLQYASAPPCTRQLKSSAWMHDHGTSAVCHLVAGDYSELLLNPWCRLRRS